MQICKVKQCTQHVWMQKYVRVGVPEVKGWKSGQARIDPINTTHKHAVLFVYIDTSHAFVKCVNCRV